MMDEKELLELADRLEMIFREHDQIGTNIVKEATNLMQSSLRVSPDDDVASRFISSGDSQKLSSLLAKLDSEIKRMNPLLGFIVGANKYIENKIGSYQEFMKDGYDLIKSAPNSKSIN